MLDLVRVYDPVTERITTIPAAELAPGMVRARVVGVDGIVWIETKRLSPSPGYRHPPFDGERREAMEVFSAVFADVYPMSPDEWEDGFRRDMNPDREIALWHMMAEAYLHFTAGRSLSPQRRKDIFDVILSCVCNGPSHAHLTVSPHTLSKKNVKLIANYMGRVHGRR